MDDEERIYAERPNKTVLKKETDAVKALIKRLIELGDTHFNALVLSDNLRTALSDAKRFTHSARKRQVLYIVKIMRDEDTDAIAAQIDKLEQPDKQAVAEFHQVEAWRDALLAGDNSVIDTLRSTFNQVDIQHLRQLTRNAEREKKQNKPPKSARLLFQYLKDLQQT